MDPAEAVLLAILVVLIPLFFRGLTKIQEKCDTRSKNINDRLISTETKMDIYLHHSGFDVGKVNKAIKEHKEEIEELKQNGSPAIGCIDIESLYRAKEN
jgi:hypothetical protein